jgi:hypothetical protein
MQAAWIVSANAGRARFFSQANATEPLQEIHDMVNTAAVCARGKPSPMRWASVLLQKAGTASGPQHSRAVMSPTNRPPNTRQKCSRRR